MTYANNLDPDEAPQNVGLHLRSKLFDIQIIYQQNIWKEALIFCIFLKKKIFEKITQHAELIDLYFIFRKHTSPSGCNAWTQRYATQFFILSKLNIK